MTRIATLAAALLATAVFAPAAQAQDVAITNARLVIGDGSAPIDGGTVVVRGGKVVSAGAGGAPAGMSAIDARGAWVTPGLVAGFSRIGLVEIDAVEGSNDTGATRSPFNAAIDIAPALNPLGSAIAVNRAYGVTRALVYPGSSSGLFRGRGAVVDLGADRDMLTRGGVFQYVEFGERGAGQAGGSRAATFLTFRALLQEARDYARNPAAYDGRSKDSILLRADAEALARVIDGRDLLFVKADRAADILNVVKLKREFAGIRLVLVGAVEGWTVAREIEAAGVPVIAPALNDLPASFEQLAATQSNVGRMEDAGVTVAIGMVDDWDVHMIHYLTQYAGNLVGLERVPGAAGLSWDEAFATISSRPAEIAGMGDVIGSLRPGRVGDVVIWDGDPLELASRPVAVYIDGVAQPLATRQDRLRDRYATPSEGALPKAYDR
ncbi:MAG: amidohydrolase family protein [Sphingomonadales bacterium]|nr:amidohydrolase family protein [Sphingomonadales bacterium]